MTHLQSGPKRIRNLPSLHMMLEWLPVMPNLNRKVPLSLIVIAPPPTRTLAAKVASDLNKFEKAFNEFGRSTEGVDVLDFDRNLAGNTSDDVAGLPLEGGFATLQTLANVPKTWPLARLTVPLSGFSKQLERLLEGYCMKIMATNFHPDQHLLFIKLFTKDLVLLLAPAHNIASLPRVQVSHFHLDSFCRPLSLLALHSVSINRIHSILWFQLWCSSSFQNLTAPSDIRDLGLLLFGAPLRPLIRWY